MFVSLLFPKMDYMSCTTTNVYVLTSITSLTFRRLKINYCSPGTEISAQTARYSSDFCCFLAYTRVGTLISLKTLREEKGEQMSHICYINS